MNLNNDTYVDNFNSKGIIAKTILKERLKIYKIFEKELVFDKTTTVLDIGVSADEQYLFSNYFEELYPYKDKITALGLYDCKFLEKRYMGLQFIQGDGTALPFKDNSFDIVFSSATIEHVGSLSKQKAFIAEAIRVAKTAVFITTPNRRFPIDFHTAIPIIHYLPKKLHRYLLNILGKKELSKEENLNLMTTHDFKAIIPKNNKYKYYFKYNYFSLLPANILFILKK